MGIVTETFINLNYPTKPALDEILDLILDLEEADLISLRYCGFASNVDQHFSEILVFNGEKLMPSDTFEIEYWGIDKNAWLEKVKENYHKKNIVLLMGQFNRVYRKEFEDESNMYAPILLFILDEKLSPDIRDLYGDAREAKGNAEKMEFGETTTFIKISSKVAPDAESLKNTTFGRYFREKYKAVIQSGYI